MNPQRSIEYLTGFLMGVFFGLGIDGIVTVLISIINRLGWSSINVRWWMMIPLPLIMGIFMSSAIANLHLEDY